MTSLAEAIVVDFEDTESLEKLPIPPLLDREPYGFSDTYYAPYDDPRAVTENWPVYFRAKNGERNFLVKEKDSNGNYKEGWFRIPESHAYINGFSIMYTRLSRY